MGKLHNRKRNRLQHYDYSTPGWYYVTICTDKMEQHFGEVINGRMKLNNRGKIVDVWWSWLSEQYLYCELDEYIIMPNHFHGIIIINSVNVVTSRDLSLRENTKIKSLSELIGAFKMKSSKEIHLAGNKTFKWQRSFYDRIIRNNKELFNIRKYIQENPLKWELEKDGENLEME
jgi:REP element-mobilizing transposase RayT